jgi:hypothetical protein
MIISGLEFIGALFAIVVIWLLYSLRGESIPEYFKTKTGKGILKGIVIVLALALVIVLLTGCSAPTGTYFNKATIYAGLDQTKNPSPQCTDEGPDNKATSNVGAKLNIYQSADERFRLNTKYTHHSCAFNPDDDEYDAVGVELEYDIWNRKR